jgi:hypothetical protein
MSIGIFVKRRKEINMGRKIEETKMFRIATNLSIYPVFYVIAKDILEATEKAKNITEYYGNNKIVGTVSAIDIPILSIEEGEE